MTEFKWADDDSRSSPRYHDINNCGQDLEVLPRRQEIPGKVKYLGQAYCTVHKIIVCKCGFEIGYHFGTYNRAFAPLPESDENSALIETAKVD